MNRILLYICTIVLFTQCADDESGRDIDLGYDYFPAQIGTFVTYKADSIFHDNPELEIPGVHDSSSYYIKELIESEFLDAEDKPSVRIERYKKDSLHQDWQLTDIWFARLNPRNAEKVEENRRYIKMGFPISENASWNGNALNDLDEWEYEYDSLYTSRIYGQLSFSNTVTVLQRHYRTQVNDEHAYEVYAPIIGLIFRHHKELYTRPSYINYPIAENIIRGNEFVWEIIEYGIEE